MATHAPTTPIPSPRRRGAASVPQDAARALEVAPPPRRVLCPTGLPGAPVLPLDRFEVERPDGTLLRVGTTRGRAFEAARRASTFRPGIFTVRCNVTGAMFRHYLGGRLTSLPSPREHLEDVTRRALAVAHRAIAALDVLAGDPDAEPDADGEEDVAEASAAPVTLAPNRVPTVQSRRRLRHVEGITSLAPTDFGANAVTAIAQPHGNPFGHAPRTFRLSDETFAPDLRRGDLVLAVPVSAYHCEGLYLLTFGEPNVALYRCEARPGAGIVAWKDNRALGYAEITLTREEFDAAVLAQVVVTGRLVCAGLLPLASMGFVA